MRLRLPQRIHDELVTTLANAHDDGHKHVVVGVHPEIDIAAVADAAYTFDWTVVSVWADQNASKTMQILLKSRPR